MHGTIGLIQQYNFIEKLFKKKKKSNLKFQANTEKPIEQNDQAKPVSMKEDLRIESLSSSSESVTDHENANEWIDIEIETNDKQNNRAQVTYYEVEKNDDGIDDSGEELTIPHDLSNDIAINQMLADQGGHYDPDAEVFDIHQYEPKINDEQMPSSSEEVKSSQPESFDYLPYHHKHTEQRPSIIK